MAPIEAFNYIIKLGKTVHTTPICTYFSTRTSPFVKNLIDGFTIGPTAHSPLKSSMAL